MLTGIRIECRLRGGKSFVFGILQETGGNYNTQYL